MTREKEISKVTLVGIAGNTLLTVFMFVAGILGNSAAMIADATQMSKGLVLAIHSNESPTTK